MTRCTQKGCGSYAFNLHQEGIDQGVLCDVHYWQAKCASLQAKIDVLMFEYCPEDITPEQMAEYERNLAAAAIGETL